MADLTSVGVTSGVPSSGTGTVGTINYLAQVGAPISNGSTSAPLTAAITGTSSAPTSSMSAVVVTLSPNGVNANGQATMANSAPVVIASNQTAIPTTVSSGTVTPSSVVSVLLSSIGFGGTTSSLSTPVVPADQYGAYAAVAAGQTQASLGSSLGRAGDYLAYVTVFPAIASCGAVTIFDSTATTIGSFAGGGTTALPTLAPFMIPIGAYSVSSGWRITTGSSVSILAVGKFT